MRLIFTILTLVLLLTTTQAQPLNAASHTDFLRAQQGITNGDDIRLYAHLSNHPLYPYLAADFFPKNLHRDNEIKPLFKHFASAPPIQKLHNLWIIDKYNRGDYTAVVQNYFDTGDSAANCAYRSAQMLSGNPQKALENIESVWLSPNAVSNLCSAAFSAWSQKDQASYLIARAKLAFYQGNTVFAETIALKLPINSAAQKTFLQFIQWTKQPEKILLELPSRLTHSELSKQLLAQVLLQLIRKDSSQYAGFAIQFAKQLQHDWHYQQMLNKLTFYLSKREDLQALQSYPLIFQPEKETTESLLRFLVTRKNWQAIVQYFDISSTNPMVLYWLARAYQARGKNANVLYRKAAKTRSYYGFLSADKLKKSYQFNLEPIAGNRSLQRQLDNNNALVRAQLLRQMGLYLQAAREIIYFSKGMNNQHIRQLAYWLKNHDFYFDAIYLLGQISDWNDINIRFPTPYSTAVQNAHRLTGVNPTWIYAIIRQESSMNPRATSKAKAKGLMQLIPSTAKNMANLQGIALSGDNLFDPATNIHLGAAYLALMSERFGNIAMASAAYNAGPHRVDAWQSDLDDMTLWVENIPFNETRRYVKRILEYQQVYAKHLGLHIPTLTQCLQGHFQAVK